MIRSLAALFAVTMMSSAVFAQTAAMEEAQEAADNRATIKTEGNFWSKLKSNTSVSYFNFSSANVDQTTQNAARISAYNYFSFDYRLGKGRKIAVRPVFYWGTAGTDYKDQYKAGDFSLGDAYINYVDYDLANLPYDIELEGQFRFYGPTSTQSQNNGLIMRVRPWFKVIRRMTRDLTVLVHLEPDYYIQSRSAYQDEDGGRPKGNKNFGYDSKVELEYRLNRTFALSGSVGHNQWWAHTSPANNINERFTIRELTSQVALNSSLGPLFLVTGISQKREIDTWRRGYRPFHQAESDFFVLANYRL